MNDLTQKVLDRIEVERVEPRPAWQFTWKNRLYWLLFALLVILASCSLSALLFSLANAGWEFASVTNDTFGDFFWSVLPSVWIIAAIVVMFLAYENFRHTKNGYRLPFLTAAGFGVLGIVVAGLALYASGFGQVVDEELGGQLPFYQPTFNRQQTMWMQPDRGLLAGEVMDVDTQNASFRIKSFDGQVWSLSSADLSPRSRDMLMSKNIVRVVGIISSVDENGNPVFKPCFVFPWDVHGGRFPSPPPMPRVAIHVEVERKIPDARSTDCKGVRPYDYLRRLQESRP